MLDELTRSLVQDYETLSLGDLAASLAMYFTGAPKIDETLTKEADIEAAKAALYMMVKPALVRLYEEADVPFERVAKKIKEQLGYTTTAIRKEMKRVAEDNKAQHAAQARADAPAMGPTGTLDDYRETPKGLLWLKRTREGVSEIPLSNFTARITAECIEDDGVETKRTFDIMVKLGWRSAMVRVPWDKFAAVHWPIEAIGADAAVAPGPMARDHVRYAVQLLSQGAPRHTLHTHLGWRKIDEQWVYLHAGGAIGESGTVTGIETAPDSALARFVLPVPSNGDTLITAIRASIRMLDVAPRTLTFPLLAAVYRAALGAIDHSLHLAGPTQIGKSEAVALAQQHYGLELDARHLPASWTSTGNALEGLAFSAKDALLVIDDFAPTGSPADVQRLHRDADRVFRAQGNQSGRIRMRADATIKAAKPPRGMILSTGEDIPRGQSLRARILIIEVSQDDMDWAILTERQKDAANGLYAQSLAGFIEWLAPQYEAIKKGLRGEITTMRAYADQDGHKRTPEIVANLILGMRYFLNFAVDAGAISVSEQQSLWASCWASLTAAARSQAKYQSAAEPARRFIELIGAVLSSGKAYLAAVEGDQPKAPASWGWRLEAALWVPKGVKIGWIDDEGKNLYLQPDASYAVAQDLARSQGDAIPVSVQTLRRRLKEKGFLASWDDKRETVTVRRVLEGKSQEVLHIFSHIFSDPLYTYKKPDKPDIDPESPPEGAETSENGQMSGFQEHAKPNKPDIDPTTENNTIQGTYDQNVGFVGFFIDVKGPTLEHGEKHTFDGKADVGYVGFSENKNPTSGLENPTFADNELITTEAQLEAALPDLRAASVIGLDTETTGLDPLKDRVRLIQLATPEHVYIVDCFSVAPRLLAPLFASPRTFIGHNIKFDLSMLISAGLSPLEGTYFDTMVVDQLLTARGKPAPGRKRVTILHGLRDVVPRYLGSEVDKAEQKSDWSTPVLTSEQLAYAATDSSILLPLFNHLQAEIAKADMQRVSAIEMRCLPAVIWMERNGVPIDTDAWSTIAQYEADRAHDIAQEMSLLVGTLSGVDTRKCKHLNGEELPLLSEERAGKKKGNGTKKETGINWNSPSQIQKVFASRGIPLTSTGEEVLKKLDDPLAALLLEYRDAAHRSSNHGENWLTKHLNSVSGRVHASYKQCGSEAGRMSATDPPIQGMPRKGGYREAVRAGAGYCIVKADYSQIELRIAAIMAPDEDMLDAFRAGVDIHALTASRILDIPLDQVSKDQRQLAKAVNFGLLYGQSANGLREYAKTKYGVSLTEREALQHRGNFFRAYPGLRAWHDEVDRQLRKKGVLPTRTLAGRRRDDIVNRNEVLNSPIQGTGADGMKLALALLFEHRHEAPAAKIIACIHDEVLAECPRDQADTTAAWLTRYMVAGMVEVVGTTIPIEVETTIGRDWAGTPLTAPSKPAPFTADEQPQPSTT